MVTSARTHALYPAVATPIRTPSSGGIAGNRTASGEGVVIMIALPMGIEEDKATVCEGFEGFLA